MYSEKLEELISAAIADGNLTDQKRNIIMRRAEKEGEDIEEVMMIVESRLQKATNAPIINTKPNETSVTKPAKEDLVGKSFVETVNGVSFKMVKVEGGIFTMFNDIERIESRKQCPSALDYAKPQKVSLDNYFIGETVVTQELWKAVMGKETVPFHFVGDKLPVNDVKPDIIYQFIDKLNKITNREYHLPSEAQWEYAAIGGKYSLGYKFAGSNESTKVAWGSENATAYTNQDMIDFYNANHFFKSKEVSGKVSSYFLMNYKKDLVEVKPVALLRPNELGLYDMSGNVNELCEDDFDNDPILNNMRNPIFRDTKANCKVCRGGSCEMVIPVLWRSCQNKKLRIDDRDKYYGFRLAL